MVQFLFSEKYHYYYMKPERRQKTNEINDLIQQQFVWLGLP